MTNSVEVKSLNKRFGDFVAVNDLNFEVHEGEVFGLLGSNGAGKSTTIRMLCGLMAPTSGSLSVLGINVATHPEEVKKAIGYMVQRFSLYQDLTVRQNIRFFGGIYGLKGKQLKEREEWAIQMSGLEGKEALLTQSLPGGWKQRLALACAILHEPKVVLLDEPTGGVDPISRRRFWNLIDHMASEKVTVLVTTHYLDEAERCDRILLMHNGRRIAMGTVTELKEIFAGRAMLEVICPKYVEAQDRLSQEEWVVEATLFGTALHIVVTDPQEGRSQIERILQEAGNTPFTVERIVPSLEDVFIHCVQSDDRKTA